MAKNTFTANWTGSSRDEIAQRAYEIWERCGRPDGQSTQHWLQAEAELAVREELTTANPTPVKARSPRKIQPMPARSSSMAGR